jgi:hypothetical protein
VLVDKTFTINISIANVTDLYGWEFKLYYNNTMLNGTGIIEGPFLNSSGSTYFNVKDLNNTYNATHGRAWATGVLLREVSGVNGSGVLASITFMCKEFGSSILQLADTTLGDPEGVAIIHTAVGGSVETWPRGHLSTDIDGDGVVDILDIAIVAKAYGSYPGHPRWNPAADLDGSGTVDILDVAKVAKDYGKKV